MAGEAVFSHEGGAEGTPFAVCIVTTAGRVDVGIAGEVDLTTREALAGVLDVACKLEAHVRLDLSRLDFLDPQGAILLARRQASHPRLEITGASAAVRRIVEILGEMEGFGDGLHLSGGSAYDASGT
jgi:anti-anti-sigma regulatory factor